MEPPKTILIVEDKPSFRLIYRDFLENEGFQVVLAPDGEKGWEACSGKKPDLVLLDLRLPGIDGFEVLRRIRSHAATRAIPVLIFSVIGDEAEIGKAKALGADGHVLKGFQPFYEVVGKIRELLVARDRHAHPAHSPRPPAGSPHRS